MTISEMITLRAGEGWTVERAVAAVSASLKEVQRLGVAFSGGVDSSLLLALAARAIGADKVVALLGVSPSLAAQERSAARVASRRRVHREVRQERRPTRRARRCRCPSFPRQ